MDFRRRPRRGPRFLAFVLLATLLFAGGRYLLERRATTITGFLYDEYTGQPVEGVEVTWESLTTYTNKSGQFMLVGVDKALLNKPVIISDELYETVEVPTDQDELRLALRPDTLAGRVLDQTGAPISGARVVSADAFWETSASGEFRLKGVARDPVVHVTAPGYSIATIHPRRDPWIEARLQSFSARGLYIGFGTLGIRERREALIQHAEKLGLNAIVLDLKSDRGFVDAAVATPLSREIGASVIQRDDLEAIVRQLKEKGWYTIARLVVFKDTLLASARPELTVKDQGRLYTDCEGQAWLDPFRREAWDYNLALAEHAARIGFHEVQFDYLRFPSDCVVGQLTYAEEATAERQRAAVESFLAVAAKRLKPLGIFLSVDVFGLTAVEEDIGVGQVIEGLARHVDYVSPMVYPSTWRVGSFGSAYPPAEPYRIVHLSVKRAVERLQETPAKVRPWLQAFGDYQRRGLPYKQPEVEAQIQAAQDAGARGWMLWDPFGSYPL